MKSIKERFDSYWTPEPFSGCWLWTGGCTPNGYAMFWIKGKGVKAHRVSWTLHRNEIPSGMLVCHSCDTPACVNPDHLFIGTNSDNMRDAFRKGRRPQHGEYHPRHKLTEDTINQIRTTTGTEVQIAAQFGISRSHVGNIKRRQRWSHEEAQARRNEYAD